jgi:hypothetical protein
MSEENGIDKVEFRSFAGTAGTAPRDEDSAMMVVVKLALRRQPSKEELGTMLADVSRFMSRRLLDQIIDTFGDPPTPSLFYFEEDYADFGAYYQLKCRWEDEEDNPTPAGRYIAKVDENFPKKWDEKRISQLDDFLVENQYIPRFDE